eukprot:m.139647 g.139647  ORF g.139647 m.139647 type:complete len:254 (-) comp17634_c0_seq7:952-1713(-)
MASLRKTDRQRLGTESDSPAEGGTVGSVQVLFAAWGAKRGHVRRNWKRRWFVLRIARPAEVPGFPNATHVFMYYKDPSHPKRQVPPAGAMPLVKPDGARASSKIRTMVTKERRNGRDCLYIETVDNDNPDPKTRKATLYVTPTAGSGTRTEWLDIITQLKVPDNEAELQRRTLGDEQIKTLCVVCVMAAEVVFVAPSAVIELMALSAEIVLMSVDTVLMAFSKYHVACLKGGGTSVWVREILFQRGQSNVHPM